MSRPISILQGIIANSVWATAVPNDRNDTSWEVLREELGFSHTELSSLKNFKFPGLISNLFTKFFYSGLLLHHNLTASLCYYLLFCAFYICEVSVVILLLCANI